PRNQAFLISPQISKTVLTARRLTVQSGKGSRKLFTVAGSSPAMVRCLMLVSRWIAFAESGCPSNQTNLVTPCLFKNHSPWPPSEAATQSVRVRAPQGVIQALGGRVKPGHGEVFSGSTSPEDPPNWDDLRSEEHTSELQSRQYL